MGRGWCKYFGSLPEIIYKNFRSHSSDFISSLFFVHCPTITIIKNLHLSHQLTFSSINASSIDFLTNWLYSSLARIIATFKTFCLIHLSQMLTNDGILMTRSSSFFLFIKRFAVVLPLSSEQLTSSLRTSSGRLIPLLSPLQSRNSPASQSFLKIWELKSFA